MNELNQLQRKLHDVLIEHTQLFSPCEQNYTLHEIVHVFEQLWILVLPVVIHYLCMKESTKPKGHDQECGFTLASIVKGFALEEFVTQIIGLGLKI